MRAHDAFGNTVIGYTGTVTFSSTDTAATLPANYMFTVGVNGDNGAHTFIRSLRFGTAGLQTVTVQDLAVPAIKEAVTVTVN